MFYWFLENFRQYIFIIFIPFSSTPPESIPLLTLSILCLHFLLTSQVYFALTLRPFSELWLTFSTTLLSKKTTWLSLSDSYQLSMGRASWSPPVSMLGFYSLAWACTGLVQAVTTTASLWLPTPLCPEKSFHLVIYHRHPLQSFWPHFHNDPWALGGASMVDVSVTICILRCIKTSAFFNPLYLG